MRDGHACHCGKKSGKMTLDQAAAEARSRGLVGDDYHSLDSHARGELQRLMARTAWRQSGASAASGRSRAYAFHQALRRRGA